VFEGFAQHAFFGLDVVLKVGCREPDLDALSDVLDGVREDDFRVIIVLSGYEQNGNEK
jgi:hypothetical protein